MIPFTAEDRRVLALGREQGIGDGFTVPANVPGEALGSCSFANEAGRPMRDEMLPLAQLAGAFAFEGRSEEHTSELQSLMRISYAVFCLKKKKTRHHTTE